MIFQEVTRQDEERLHSALTRLRTDCRVRHCRATCGVRKEHCRPPRSSERPAATARSAPALLSPDPRLHDVHDLDHLELISSQVQALGREGSRRRAVSFPYVSRLLTPTVRNSGTEFFCGASGSGDGQVARSMAGRSEMGLLCRFPAELRPVGVFSATSGEVWRAFFLFSGAFCFPFQHFDKPDHRFLFSADIRGPDVVAPGTGLVDGGR